MRHRQDLARFLAHVLRVEIPLSGAILFGDRMTAARHQTTSVSHNAPNRRVQIWERRFSLACSNLLLPKQTQDYGLFSIGPKPTTERNLAF